MNRYCTKCGNITTKKNDSLFLCIDGHENWMNPAVGAVVAVFKNGKVLYGVRSIDPNKGKLSLPGGFVEVGETAEQTAIREVKEEMGIGIELLDYIGTYVSLYDGRPSLDLVFMAACVHDNLVTGDDMEGGAPEWRSIDDLPGQNELAFGWHVDAQKDIVTWWEQNKDILGKVTESKIEPMV